MRKFFARLYSSFTDPQRTTHRRRRRNTGGIHQGLTFDKLEDRQLLAVIFLDPSTHVLTYAGTSGNDVASADMLNANTFRLNANNIGSRDFAIADVQSLVFIGYAGDDYFENNTPLASLLLGHTGNDRLLGGSGNDRLVGGPGDDNLDGRAGDDTLVGASGNDTLRGGTGNDRIFGSFTGTNLIYGDDGDDTIFGGDGVDTIYGGAGLDKIYALAGNDVLFSGAGGVAGTTGTDNADLVLGNDGDDLITGESGLDVMFGGNGNDTIVGGTGENRIHGQVGNDQLHGGNGNDLLFGGSGDDILFGYGGDDLLFGGIGNDTLYGGGGIDGLFGESGNDGLFAGVNGAETMNGGSGADRFLVTNLDSAGDPSNEDAVIHFINILSSWNDQEIEVIDNGLRAVHQRTGSTTFFKDTLDPNEIKIYKYAAGALGTNVRSLNNLSYLGTIDGNGNVISETYTRTYSFADWDETSRLENEASALSIIHELSHSWDSSFEIAQKLPNQASLWNSFLSVSGWRSDGPASGYTQAIGQTQEPFDRVGNQAVLRSWWYLNQAQFSRSYGRTNPAEDWGTAWESVFYDQLVAFPDAIYTQIVPAKAAIVNQILDAL